MQTTSGARPERDSTTTTSSPFPFRTHVQPKTIAELRSGFAWNIPARYNMAVDVCDRWIPGHANRVALIHDARDGLQEISYGQLLRRSNRLANLLSGIGIGRSDRVGILLPQNPWTAVSHIAVWKMAGISVPLFTLFGVEALEYRLADSAAKAVITDTPGVEKLEQVRERLPDLEHVLCIDGGTGPVMDMVASLDRSSDRYATRDTAADDPALLVYTSGTTGNPKGALHAHRTLLGHLPGVEMSHDLLPVPGDRIWTPADWAWIGGLMDVLMPALYHGVPVVSCDMGRFDGEFAFRLIRKHGIRNAFLPPTALKMMRMVWQGGDLPEGAMRSIACAGESMGGELLEWGKEAFGIWINEFYGQTECNMIVSSCGVLEPPVPGVMGYPAPGHDVRVIDGQGQVLGAGEAGQIAVRGRNPVMFLNYWNSPEQTRQKFSGEWLLTGDTGMMVDSGAIRFVGRMDDIITSSGYRIGPGEIENCLLGHPAVALSAVVGKPDALRTEIVKAFVRLNKGYDASDRLSDELKDWVRHRLSAHEYPREIAFIGEFPMTATGKIIRRKLRDIA